MKIRNAVVWMNIALQALSPLALSLSPAVAAGRANIASSADRPHSSVELAALSVRPYTLKPGETVAIVAARAGLSVPELQTLNQLRTFTVAFTRLPPGSEIDIPASPRHSGGHAATPSPGTRAEQRDEKEDTAMMVAQGLRQAGQLAVSDDASAYASGQALSMASGAVNNSVSAWLKPYGTARVQLGVDSQLSLNGSAFDFLYPWYDNQQTVLFTQQGVRNKDHRNTLNLGAGVRHLYGDWMLGINTFYDNDLTGHNRRWGLGTEAWRDNLKLSANGYFRLTNWHQSRDRVCDLKAPGSALPSGECGYDYDERPASGFDISAEAWLPSLPQLGGKLKYEQYYGDEVALFSVDRRSQDPKALTVGVTYTPIPLLAFNADYRKGTGGQDDTRFGVMFNYDIGRPWSEQINPDSVALGHSLARSRLDLVERNNDIILEYRKQTLVRLSVTPEQAKGKGLDRLTLTVKAWAKHGLNTKAWPHGIQWSGEGLDRLKGFDCTDTQCQVTLPEYNTASPEANSYLLQAVAQDMAGRQSPPVSVLLSVEKIQGSAAQTPAPVIDPPVIIANGGSAPGGQAKITWSPLDAAGQPLTGIARNIHFTVKSLRANGGRGAQTEFKPGPQAWQQTPDGYHRAFAWVTSAIIPRAVAADTLPANNSSVPVVGVVTEEAPGVYGAQIFSGIRSGEFSVTPEVNGVTYPSASLTLKPDEQSATIPENGGEITQTPVNAETGGVRLGIPVTDKFGNPVVGTTVHFTPQPGPDFQGIITTDPVGGDATTGPDGVASITVYSTRAGTFRMNVTTVVNGRSVPVMVTVRGGMPDVSASTLTLARQPVDDQIIAGEVVDLLLTVKDKHGNPVTGLQELQFHYTLNGQSVTLDTSPAQDPENSGLYAANAQAEKAGILVVTADYLDTDSGVRRPLTAQALTLTVMPGQVSAGTSTLSRAPDVIPAGSGESRLSLALKDAFGNPVDAGADAVAFMVVLRDVTGAEVVLPYADAVSDGQGGYTASVRSERAGVLTLTPELNGVPVAGMQTTVQVLADTATVVPPASIPDSDITDSGPGVKTVSVLVQDANGNTVISGVVPVRGEVNPPHPLQVSDFSVTPASDTPSTLTDEHGRVPVTVQNLTGETQTVPVTIFVNGKPVTRDVTLPAATADAGRSDLTASGTAVTPGGSITATLTVRDSQGNLLSRMPGTHFSLLLSDEAGHPLREGTDYTLGAVTETAGRRGEYTALLTLNKTSGATGHVLTASLSGSAVSGTPRVVVNASPDDARLKPGLTFPLTATDPDKDGIATVTVPLVDRHDNPVPGATLTLSNPTGGVVFTGGATSASVVSDGQGDAILPLVNHSAQAVTVTLSTSVGNPASTQDITVTVPGAQPDARFSTFEVDKTTMMAGETATLTFAAKNEQGPVTGIPVGLVSFTGNTEKDGPVSTSSFAPVTETAGSGRYTTTLSWTKKETLTLMSSAAGVGSVPAEHTLAVTPDITSAKPEHVHATLSGTPDTHLADGQYEHEIVVTVTDRYGNRVPGVGVAFEITDKGAASPVTPVTVNRTEPASGLTSSEDGTLKAYLTSKTAGTYEVMASVTTGTTLPPGETRKAADRPVTFVADARPLNVRIREPLASPVIKPASLSDEGAVVADGTSAYVQTLQVEDRYGNPVGAGVAVSINAAVSGDVKPSSILLAADGKNGAGKIIANTDAQGRITLEVSTDYPSPVAGPNPLDASIQGGSDVKTRLPVMRFVAGLPVAGPDKSTLAVAPSILEAGAVATLTLVLKDKDNSAVSGRLGRIGFEVSDEASDVPTRVTGLTEVSQGTYTGTLEAGSQSGPVTLKVTYTKASGETSVISGLDTVLTLTAGKPAMPRSDFVPDKSDILTTGTDTVALTLTLQDVYGNPVTGVANRLSVQRSMPETHVTAFTEGTGAQAGVYRTELTMTPGAMPGALSLTPVLDSEVMDSLAVGLTVNDGYVLTGVSLKTVPEGLSGAALNTTYPLSATLLARNSAGATIELPVEDYERATGKQVSIGSWQIGAAGVKNGFVTTSNPSAGVQWAVMYTQNLPAPPDGLAQDKDELWGVIDCQTVEMYVCPQGITSYTSNKIPVTVSPALTSGATMTVTDNNALADGAHPVSVKVRLLDSQGRPVSDMPVTFAVTATKNPTNNINGASNTDAHLSVSTPVKTDADGVATVTVTSSKAVTYTITATTQGDRAVSLSKDIDFVAGVASLTETLFRLDKPAIVADGHDTALITLDVLDAYGNRVTGSTVGVVKKTDDGKITISAVQEVSKGIYTAQVTSVRSSSGVQEVSKMDFTIGGRVMSLTGFGITTTPVALTNITAKNHEFGLDEAFPKTGYQGASFTLNMTPGTNANLYNWTSSQGWLSVTDGVVTFNSKPEAGHKNVMITATLKTNALLTMNYELSPDTWFISSFPTEVMGHELDAACTRLNALPVPWGMLSTYDLTLGNGGSGTRGVGTFWGEWGMSPHGESHWSGMVYPSDSQYRYEFLNTGGAWVQGYNNPRPALCYKTL